MKYLKTYNDFISESEAYDEPADTPNASFRQEDWSAKDKLGQVSYISDELVRFIEDGEQLDKSQIDLINSLFKNVNSLRRQIQGREEIKQKEEEKKYRDLDNPNL